MVVNQAVGNLSVLENQDTPYSSDDNAEHVTTVTFKDDDPECPYNWSNNKKRFIVATILLTVLNSTLGSSLPSNAIPHIAYDFGVSTDDSNPERVLPISIFLVGYVFGPLLFGPLSEWYGRRYIILLTFGGYTVSVVGCALSPDWVSLLIFRFLGGIFGSAPIAIVGGIFADIYGEPKTRGRAISYFITTAVCGPLVSPILAGFVAEASWRWAFWAALIIVGITWGFLVFLPETYGPIILAQRAARLRETARKTAKGDVRIYAPIELENKGLHHLVTVILARPLKMLFTEMIVTAVCLYLAMAYAIFYMFFQAYPIVFRGIYGMSPEITGLMFLPVGAGSILGLGVFILYDNFLERERRANKPWTRNEEMRRLPIACVGGPLFVVGLLWLGWTARSDIHWVVPFLAGVPLGMGNLFLFIGLLNYLGDAYSIFSASAMSASSCSRSIFGAVLPLATTPMYHTWGVGWASSFLALVSLAMTFVPLFFIYYGDAIRERSAFCQMLKQKQAADVSHAEGSEEKEMASNV
ncbi:hypothetical protein S40285_07908 [Stachybotrys chlorohalonatus IBT 40285]|uniref:Major facilitator superfamily (MFS) profile domain-containing protein n=1 Tax=Stachybotrys chlorohalonatus (strain IBT 40285) TaxID=1283841 RepID=A0A084QDG1_STAC4|nr:hypothetical protein S40285_07908 [Stachybotrys chlorohalonata IBT 40285]